MRFIFLVLSTLAAGASALAATPDDTASLRALVTSASVNSSGIRVVNLSAGTYYVRGELAFIDTTTATLYDYRNNLEIHGHRNASGQIDTRIVAGIGLLLSECPLVDATTNLGGRLPLGMGIRVATLQDTLQNWGTTEPYLGRFNHQWTTTTDQDYTNVGYDGADDDWYKVTAMVNGEPLRYAMDRDPGSGNAAGSTPLGWTWNRTIANSATTTTLNFDPAWQIGNDPLSCLVNRTEQQPPITDWPTVANSHLDSSNLRATVFVRQDYDPIELGLESIQKLSANDVEVSFTHYQGQNPFNPFTVFGGLEPCTDFGWQQRVRLWNAPEFLLHPGQMIVDPRNKRLYFIPPTGAEIGDTLEICLPNRTEPKINPAPLRFKGASNVTIADIEFANTAGYAVVMDGSNDVAIQNCKFRNVGRGGVYARRSKKIIVSACDFKWGNKGFLQLWDDRPNSFTFDPRTWNEGILNTKEDFHVSDNFFTYSGRVYPSDSAVLVGNSATSALVQSNVFKYMSGRCVQFSGTGDQVCANSFNDCVTDVSDAGAVYTAGTLTRIGGYVGWNSFTNIGRVMQAHRPVGTSAPGGDVTTETGDDYADGGHIPYGHTLYDDISCIFYDDFMSGQTSSRNAFNNCTLAYKLNGGRAILIGRNKYNHSAIIKVTRATAVGGYGTQGLLARAKDFYKATRDSGTDPLTAIFPGNDSTAWSPYMTYGAYNTTFPGFDNAGHPTNHPDGDRTALAGANWSAIDPALPSTWDSNGLYDFFRPYSGGIIKNKGLYLEYLSSDLTNVSAPTKTVLDDFSISYWRIPDMTTLASEIDWGLYFYVNPYWRIPFTED